MMQAVLVQFNWTDVRCVILFVHSMENLDLMNKLVSCPVSIISLQSPHEMTELIPNTFDPEWSILYIASSELCDYDSQGKTIHFVSVLLSLTDIKTMAQPVEPVRIVTGARELVICMWGVYSGRS